MGDTISTVGTKLLAVTGVVTVLDTCGGGYEWDAHTGPILPGVLQQDGAAREDVRSGIAFLNLQVRCAGKRPETG